VRGGREDGHVDADLSNELLGADPSDAGHRIQLGDLGRERSDLLVDLRGQLLDLGGEVVDPLQHHPAEEPVMVVEVASQGLLELAELGAHARAGQLGEHLGVTLSCDHRLEHLAARHPKMSLATLDSLIWASSRSFSTRCCSRVRSRISVRR
jgi:hypothetical protein